MIFPSAGDELTELTDLAEAYAYPQERWLRVNFVSSADGAATADGVSGGLSGPDDKRIFGILRVLTDLVLVGAGTAQAEKYKPQHARPSLAALRAGRSAAPPIALVTRTLDLDLTAPLFTEAAQDSRTVVVTCASVPEDRRDAAAKVADVIVAGEDTVDLTAALDQLAGRGHTRVLCEGGPHLFGDLARAGLVDELCLSFSPTLAGPGASRIIAGDPFDAQSLTLNQVLAGDDGFLFYRYFAEKH